LVIYIFDEEWGVIWVVSSYDDYCCIFVSLEVFGFCDVDVVVVVCYVGFLWNCLVVLINC